MFSFNYFYHGTSNNIALTASNNHNEFELLRQVAAGKELAFRALFDLYRIRLYSFVFQFTHSNADTEEIVQETFLKLWENRQGLTEVRHPRNYIYTIARNLTLNYLDKVARNEQLVKQVWANMRTTQNNVEEMLAAKEDKAVINEALSYLSEQKQQVFRMSREQGMNHEEIAQQLGLSRSRVKNILVEVLKYLRNYIEPQSYKLATALWLVSIFFFHD